MLRLAKRLVAILVFALLRDARLPAQTSLQVGYVTLMPDAGTAPLAGAALFSYTNSDGVLVSQAGVGASEPIRSGRTFIDETASLMGVALSNSSPNDALVTLTLRDAAGLQRGQEMISLGAHQHRAAYVSELFPNRSPGSIGTLTFESTQPLSAITLRESRNARGEPVYTTIPVTDMNAASATQPAAFPQIAIGGAFTTQVLLVNTTRSPMHGRIATFDSDGQTLLADRVYEIAVDGAYRTELEGGGDVKAGYALVLPDPGTNTPSGTAIFRYKSETELVTEAGVGAVNATAAMRLFVDYVGTQTGVALANPSDAAAELTLTLMDRFGFIQSSTQRVMVPHSHLARYVHELFPVEEGFTGLLEVRSSIPVFPTALKLSTNARRELVLTTLPVADLNRLASSSTVVFPHVAIGGAFATRLIIINASTSNIASGHISFYQSSGAPFVTSLNGQTASDFAYGIAQGAARQFYPGNTARLARIVLIDPSSQRSTNELVINAGNTVHPALQMIDSAGMLRDDFDVAVASIDSNVAETDRFGNVRGKAEGFSTLSLAAGGVLITATATVVKINSGVAGYGANGITQDQARRLYLASSTDHVVWRAEDVKQTPDVYAGVRRIPGLKNDQRLQSLFKQPAFVALNQSDGSLYVSDSANNVIRRVLPGVVGTVETVSDGFNNPQGIGLDDRGYLWIADSGNDTIRRLNLKTGTVETVAGQAGIAGFADGIGAAARFKAPVGLAVETETVTQQVERARTGAKPAAIHVIVADAGNSVLRRVGEDGVVETIGTANTAFTSPVGVATDPFGNVYVSESHTGAVKVVLLNGQVTTASQAGTFQHPSGIAIAKAGSVVVADSDRSAQEVQYGAPQITRITPDHVRVGGGTALTIEGRNFAPDSIVIAAGVMLANAIVDNTTRIRFTAPSGMDALPSGITTVTVQNRAGLAQASLLIDAVSLDQLPIGYVTTVAGGSTFIGDGQPATSATLKPWGGIAIDVGGNLFIVDEANSRIRRVDARTGIITTVAGNGQNEFAGDGGPALLASLDSPHGVAFDGAGNLLIAEFAGRFRRVDAQTGIIKTIAGSPGAALGDGGPAIAAGFNPSAIALDAAGNIFIAEYFNSRVRKIDARSGIITTVAGDGRFDFAGDGGLAVRAALRRPVGVAVDSGGNIFIADTDNHRIRRVDAKTGIIATVVGTGEYSTCDDGTLALNCPVSAPIGLTIDSDNNLIYSDQNANRRRVRKVSNGIVTTLAGRGDSDIGFSGDGGPAVQAGIGVAWATALDAAGNLFLADAGSLRVRRVDGRTGVITTAAGNGSEHIIGDQGPATSATVHRPTSLAFDSSGNLFIATADYYYSRIRKVAAATGIITTAVGCAHPPCGDSDIATEYSLYEPFGLAFDRDSNLYFSADYCCVRKLDGTGHLVKIAGTYPATGLGDGGAATAADIGISTRLATYEAGNQRVLYIADPGHYRVRRVDLNTGIITTVAGNGTDQGVLGDGGPAVNANLSHINGIAVDSDGNLFIASGADYPKGWVRRVDAGTGIITTVVGGGSDFHTDARATEAALAPFALTLDANGRLFFVDAIRWGVFTLDSSNRLVRVAGGAGQNSIGLAGDNGPALAARFRFGYPPSLLFDSFGNLFIADQDNHRIRAVRGPIP